MADALSELADMCGIFPEFIDLGGDVRRISPETQRALIRANGLAADTDGEARDTLAALRAKAEARVVPVDVVVTCDQNATIACARPREWHVTQEDTGRIIAEGKSGGDIDLPGLPAGVHDLHIQCGQVLQHATLIAAPDRTPSLADVLSRERTWGIVAPLYGLTSPDNQGLGDFEDLAQLGEGLGALGAGFLGINPVHALGWADEATISPYSPTHRGFLNTNHIRATQMPNGPTPKDRHAAPDALIDYATFAQQHRDTLRTAFAAFRSEASEATRQELRDFAQAGGEALADFALYEALSETKGSDWRIWPDALRTPSGARMAHPDEDTEFHIWLQWMAMRQLESAQKRSQDRGLSLGLYLDLAVGARLDGAEAWAAADTLAQGVSLGAPPDQLSPAGQNWQLAAYSPHRLQAHKYRPLRQVLRQVMQTCGVLRIDHVLGLNRSYWIPQDGSAGGYIRQPFQSLMAIIAIEAQRAGTVIVGEDLGLVPDGFRDTMAAKGFYGYTVVQYEKTDTGKFRKARELRPHSLACFGTHDTPTIKGFWEADDIAWWHRLDWIDAADKLNAEKRREGEKAALLGVPRKALKSRTAGDLADKVHADLAAGPTALVAVQLDDALGICDAQNLPGTIDEHPNWRRRTPVPVDKIAQHPGVRRVVDVMIEAGRGTPKIQTRKDMT